MSTVTVNFTTSEVNYPAGSATSGTLVTLVVPDGAAAIPAQTIAPGVLTVNFDNVPVGNGYIVNAQLLDPNSVPFGAVGASSPFNVEPPVSIATPNIVTVTVS